MYTYCLIWTFDVIWTCIPNILPDIYYLIWKETIRYIPNIRYLEPWFTQPALSTVFHFPKFFSDTRNKRSWKKNWWNIYLHSKVNIKACLKKKKKKINSTTITIITAANISNILTKCIFLGSVIASIIDIVLGRFKLHTVV